MENPFHSQPGPSTPSGRAGETSSPTKGSVPLLEELLQAPSFDRVETEPLALTPPPLAPAVTPVEKSVISPGAPTMAGGSTPIEFAQAPTVRELTQLQAEAKSPFVMVQAPSTNRAEASPSPFTMVQASSPPKVAPNIKPPPLAVNRRMPKPSIPNEEIEPPKKSQPSIEQISSLQILLLGCLIAILAVLLGLVYDVTQRDGRWARRYLPQIFAGEVDASKSRHR